MENSVFIDRVSWKARRLIASIAGEDYGFNPFPTTVKHIEMCLDSLELLDEEMAKEVIEGLERTLEKKEMQFYSDDKMTCFFISLFYQMIQRDERCKDVIYIREEVYEDEWDDDNDNSNQSANGKDSSKN